MSKNLLPVAAVRSDVYAGYIGAHTREGLHRTPRVTANLAVFGDGNRFHAAPHHILRILAPHPAAAVAPYLKDSEEWKEYMEVGVLAPVLGERFGRDESHDVRVIILGQRVEV